MNIPEQQSPLTVAVVTLAYALDALALYFIDDDDATMRPEKVSECVVAAADAGLDIDSITPIQFAALFGRTQPPLRGLEALAVARGKRSLGQFARFGARLGDECRRRQQPGRPDYLQQKYYVFADLHVFADRQGDVGVCGLVECLLTAPLPIYEAPLPIPIYDQRMLGIKLVEHDLTLIGVQSIGELYDAHRLPSFSIFEQRSMTNAMLRCLCTLSSSLTHLFIIDCSLVDDHVTVICTTILPSVVYLNIQCNEITNVGGQLLLDHRRTKKTLVIFTVAGNPMTDEMKFELTHGTTGN